MIRPTQSDAIRSRFLADRRSGGSTKFLIEREIEPWATIRAKASKVQPSTPVLLRPLSQPGQGSPGGMRRVLTMAQGAWAELTRDKFWLSCALLFALLWAIELWAVQEMTIASAHLGVTRPRYMFWVPKIRIAFDLCFAIGITLCLRRRWLALICFVSLFIDLALVTYYANFQRSLSLLSVFTQWSEAFQAGDFALALVPKWPAIVLSAVLVAKLGLLATARRPRFSGRFSFGMGCVFAMVFCGMHFAVNQLDPVKFPELLQRREVAYFCMSRGYTVPWLMEWMYLGNEEVLKSALADRMQSSDRLTPVEAPLSVGNRLVFIQVESMGFNVMGAVVNGKQVTPFLNQLKDQAFFYRVTAPTYNGSADADFSMLTATQPSKNTINYNIPGYPFDNALPRFLAKFDYRSTALMGDRGNFYNRRLAYEKMRFTQTLFAEEIVAKYAGRIESFGIRDSDLLPISSLLLRKSTDKVCHFVVTVSSHGPFNTVRDSEKEIFPNSKDMNENYFNSIRYVDNTLRSYIVSLPTNTTVVIYGDHTSPGSYEGYTRDRSGQNHRVPCLIYNVGRDIGNLQRTRGQDIATSGELTLTDISNYLRAQVAQSQESAPNAQDVHLASSK